MHPREHVHRGHTTCSNSESKTAPARQTPRFQPSFSLWTQEFHLIMLLPHIRKYPSHIVSISDFSSNKYLEISPRSPAKATRAESRPALSSRPSMSRGASLDRIRSLLSWLKDPSKKESSQRINNVLPATMLQTTFASSLDYERATGARLPPAAAPTDRLLRSHSSLGHARSYFSRVYSKPR